MIVVFEINYALFYIWLLTKLFLSPNIMTVVAMNYLDTEFAAATGPIPRSVEGMSRDDIAEKSRR